MDVDKLNAEYDKWWASEEAGLPPMFSGEIVKSGIKALTKIAFQQGVISFANQLMPPQDK